MNAADRAVLDGDGSSCFGCGQDNLDGFRLQFRITGPTTVEATCDVPERYQGSPQTIHGGIQAAILDEALGKATHLGFEDGWQRKIVTAEFSIRYRKPVPLWDLLTVRATFLRSEGDDVYVSGALVGVDGTELTTAEARWKVIGRIE